MSSKNPQEFKYTRKQAPVGAEYHRSRMMERFFKTIDYDFDERETLEMLLYYSIPRSDTRDAAVELLKRFGSLQNVLHGDIHSMMAVDGIGPVSAEKLRLFSEAIDRICAPEELPPPISTENMTEQIIQLFRSQIEVIPPEPYTWIALFDTAMRPLIVRPLLDGRLTPSETYMRRILDCIVMHDASAFALARVGRGQIGSLYDSELAAVHLLNNSFYVLGRTFCDFIVINETDGVSARQTLLL